MEKHAAIIMVDLAGFTAMTDIHGGASAATLVKKFLHLVEHSLHGETKLMQQVGDQVVLLADSATDLLHTAQRLLVSSLHEEHFLSVHAGIHYGSLFMEENRLFGSTINIASRIMNQASGGQVLASADFIDQLGAAERDCFTPLGSFRMKNLREKVDLFELLHEYTVRPFFVDPVCHMLVDPEKETWVFTIGHKTYHFCSAHCMELFESDPESFF